MADSLPKSLSLLALNVKRKHSAGKPWDMMSLQNISKVLRLLGLSVTFGL